MDAAAVMEVIDLIGGLFDHIPYAVCGTAALIYYGYRGYRPDHVSITCPEESKEAMRCWALTKGMTLSPNDPDGFRVRTSDRRTWAVCIKFMKSGFQNLLRIRVGPSRTSIVTLPSIANTIARSYVARLHSSSTERQAVYAKYMFWTLRRIIQMSPECGDQRLAPQRVRDLTSREFWIPFTLSFPEVVPLLASAGLELVDGCPRQWQAEDLYVLAHQRGSFQSYTTLFADVFYDDADDYDPDSTPPSLRRVTRRLPPPQIRPPPLSYTSPSQPGFSTSGVPTFVLTTSSASSSASSSTTTTATTTTTSTSTSCSSSRYDHVQQRARSGSHGSARTRIGPKTLVPQVWI